jgi:hypothetical protein
MKYYNTELENDKRDENILNELLQDLKKSVDFSLKNLKK